MIKPGICTECYLWTCEHVDEFLIEVERKQSYIRNLELALHALTEPLDECSPLPAMKDMPCMCATCRSYPDG